MSSSSSDAEHGERLPVHLHELVDKEGARETQAHVFCPERRRSVPLETCAGCGRGLAVPATPPAFGAVVECQVTGTRKTELLARRTGADVGEAATRVRLGEAMARRVTAVRPDVPVADAKRLLDAGAATALLVEDEHGRIAGIATRRDLARGKAKVQDVMSPFVHTLPEDACLSHAIAVMAHENVRQVPVVDGDGRPVGMICDRDLTRWIARRIGYDVSAPPWEEPSAAPTRHPLEEVRARVRTEHAHLRILLESLDGTAKRVVAGDFMASPLLRDMLRRLSTALRVHFGMEEAQLGPALATRGGGGVATWRGVRDDHDQQRARLARLVDEELVPARTDKHLAEEARVVVAELLAEMAREEAAMSGT